MKFGIDIGHNCPPETGARGIQIEDNLTLDLVNSSPGQEHITT
jgi:N-acetylmuramoyl-L-alanine amidase